MGFKWCTHAQKKWDTSISHTNIRCFRKLGLWGILRIKLVHARVGGTHTVKELVPIVISAAIWGHSWREKTVLVQCDNTVVVSIVNQTSSNNKEAMHLARCLAFIPGKFDFHMEAMHIKGANNILADALSRKNLLFLSLHPQADKEPSSILESLLDLLIISKPDWTSKNWTELWSSTFRTA